MGSLRQWRRAAIGDNSFTFWPKPLYFVLMGVLRQWRRATMGGSSFTFWPTLVFLADGPCQYHLLHYLGDGIGHRAKLSVHSFLKAVLG